jgi:hypothetical protein
MKAAGQEHYWEDLDLDQSVFSDKQNVVTAFEIF